MPLLPCPTPLRITFDGYLSSRPIKFHELTIKERISNVNYAEWVLYQVVKVLLTDKPSVDEVHSLLNTIQHREVFKYPELVYYINDIMKLCELNNMVIAYEFTTKKKWYQKLFDYFKN